MLTISGKALGRKKSLFEDWSIPFPPDLGGGTITLRDLIGRVVVAEVQAFQKRQEERKVFRALTAKDISAGAEHGKIDMGGRDLGQVVDAEEAVRVALQAFADGLYLVVVDGQDRKGLDEPVALQPDSRVTFVRLTMLAGG